MKSANRLTTLPSLTSIAAIALLAGSTPTRAAENITDALTGGKVSTNLQLRYENVAENNPLKNAKALTARLRLGYTTDTFKGFGAMVEAETLTALGNKNYDSKAAGQTANGYSVVADPEATEINQAYLSYSGLPNTTAKWGHQRIKLDNDRFIGNVGWRQNEQTFDAFTLVNKSLPDTTITAGYITNVNRVFSDNAFGSAGNPNAGPFSGNHKMGSTILNANYKGWGFAEIVGYAYLLDYDAMTGFTANSTDTYGIRLKGSAPIGGNKLLYTAELAQQSNAHGNATNYTANYTLLEVGVDVTGVATFKVGYEVLGSGTGAANTAFKTPLATLHAFNGWADLFLITPSQGLEDAYVSAGTRLADTNLEAIYHDFKADKSTPTINDLGKELDLVATYAFDKNYAVGLKYADYSPGDAAAIKVGTKKTWLWGEFKF